MSNYEKKFSEEQPQFQNSVFVCNVFNLDAKRIPVRKYFRIKTEKYGLWLICKGILTDFEKNQIAKSLNKRYFKNGNKIK